MISTRRFPNGIKKAVELKVNARPVLDMHTHLFTPAFGKLNKWGVDDLLTYHYLQAEYFRQAQLDRPGHPPKRIVEEFNGLGVPEQADVIYNTLFVEHTPASEACRGVLTALALLGQEPGKPDLTDYRKALGSIPYQEHVKTVFQLAGINRVVMTNDPFVDDERAVWQKGSCSDEQFWSALRVDQLFSPKAENITLSTFGFHINDTVRISRFLRSWIKLMSPVYMAASLPPDFNYSNDKASKATGTDNAHIKAVLDKAVLPVARDAGLPLALMIGVKRGVNPLLGLAGDGVGQCSVEAVERLCAENPGNRFFVTLLSDTNQRELAVAARKFPNLMPFGCWWFLNTPAEIARITTLRMELLGATFVPQHSDARVLDQLIYKWAHSRQVLTDVLTAQYESLPKEFPLSEAMIERDVAALLGGNFDRFLLSANLR